MNILSDYMNLKLLIVISGHLENVINIGELFYTLYIITSYCIDNFYFN